MDCSPAGSSAHGILQATEAKSLQSCPTLCNPIDGSPPGSPVPGILEARTVGCHFLLHCMKVKSKSEVTQSSVTLSDPMDCSPPGSAVPGIFQARTLEWVAISFSNAWKWKVKVKSLSHVQLLATPWTAAYQAPLSMGFSRQEYRSGVPLPSLNTWAIFRFVVDLWNIAQTNLCTITIKCRIRSSIYKYR